MSNYSEFFLNSASSVVQLELIEITHPNFGSRYRIVRNAIAGVIVTLEDSSTGIFEYYPVKLAPSGSDTDLDETLQVTFGDLGEVLPQELDRLRQPPAHPIYQGALIGAWVDNLGQLVTPPFLLGQGGDFYAPWNATHLQMGVNDLLMSDNSGSWAVVLNGAAPVSVGPANAPWTNTAGINPLYPIAPTSAAAPVSVAVVGGTFYRISVSGTLAIHSTDFQNGFGDPSTDGRAAGFPGSFILDIPLPTTTVKPTLTFRTYRSDDLTAPLNGPIVFAVNNIAFTKEGATLQCSAPRKNLNRTGESYSVDRFPMLAGFL